MDALHIPSRDDHGLTKLRQNSLRFLAASSPNGAGETRLLKHHVSTPVLPGTKQPRDFFSSTPEEASNHYK